MSQAAVYSLYRGVGAALFTCAAPHTAGVTGRRLGFALQANTGTCTRRCACSRTSQPAYIAALPSPLQASMGTCTRRCAHSRTSQPADAATLTPSAAGEHGDLHVVLRTQPHPTFERRGDGLLANVTISLLDALVGFQKEVGAAHWAARKGWVLLIGGSRSSCRCIRPLLCLVTRCGWARHAGRGWVGCST